MDVQTLQLHWRLRIHIFRVICPPGLHIMKVAILVEQGTPLAVDDVHLPALDVGQVLV